MQGIAELSAENSADGKTDAEAASIVRRTVKERWGCGQFLLCESSAVVQDGEKYEVSAL